jgi:hypothetical protein
MPVRSSTGIQLAVAGAVLDVADLDTVVLPGSQALAVATLDPEFLTATTQRAQ